MGQHDPLRVARVPALAHRHEHRVGGREDLDALDRDEVGVTGADAHAGEPAAGSPPAVAPTALLARQAATSARAAAVTNRLATAGVATHCACR